MKKLFMIFTAALVVFACGGGKKKSQEDPYTKYLDLAFEALMAGDIEKVALYEEQYEEWYDSLSEDEQEIADEKYLQWMEKNEDAVNEAYENALDAVEDEVYDAFEDVVDEEVYDAYEKAVDEAADMYEDALDEAADMYEDALEDALDDLDW